MQTEQTQQAQTLFYGRKDNEPDTEYHSKNDYISSSPLVEIDKSPLHFFQATYGEGKEATDAMDKGTFIHKIILEQDIAKYVPRPLNEKGELVRSNSKEYTAFLAANEGKTAIHPDLFNEANAVLTAAIQHERFMDLFSQSKPEVSFYGQHKKTGLAMKARTDLIANDYSFIVDVKSTSDMSRFEKQIFNLNYDIRLIHYLETISASVGQDVDDIYFFAIESSRPFGCKLFKLDEKSIVWAREKWDEWLSEIKVCRLDNSYPGYSQEVTVVSRPPYLRSGGVSFDGLQ